MEGKGEDNEASLCHKAAVTLNSLKFVKHFEIPTWKRLYKYIHTVSKEVQYILLQIQQNHFMHH